MTATYAFRDSDVAVERLALVAEVFEPTTRAFLAARGRREIGLALDLGCGPGHTTGLLDEVLEPQRVIGLDSSAAFVERTRRLGLEAMQHDVTATPFPPGPADLVFCRFLLTHLVDPRAVVGRWTRELRAGGRLLVEEIDHIDTHDRAFARYLATVAALLARRGTRLDAGRELEGQDGSKVVTVEPDSATVARMFALNLEAWRDEIDGALYSELAAGLAGSGHEPIVWHLRQSVYEAAR